MTFRLLAALMLLGPAAQAQMQAASLSTDAGNALQAALSYSVERMPEGVIAIDPRVFAKAPSTDRRSPWIGTLPAELRERLGSIASVHGFEFETQDVFTAGCGAEKRSCRLRAGLAGGVILGEPAIEGDSATVAVTRFSSGGLGLGRLSVTSSDLYLARTSTGWAVIRERVRVET